MKLIPEQVINLRREINEARKKSAPGPETLIDNTRFVGLTNSNQEFKVNYKKANLLYRLEQKILLKIVLRLSGFIKR